MTISEQTQYISLAKNAKSTAPNNQYLTVWFPLDILCIYFMYRDDKKLLEREVGNDMQRLLARHKSGVLWLGTQGPGDNPWRSCFMPVLGIKL